MQNEYKTSVDGANVYIVKEEIRNQKENYVLLQCIWFSEPENLGDMIFCRYQDEVKLISRYIFNQYYLIPTD